MIPPKITLDYRQSVVNVTLGSLLHCELLRWRSLDFLIGKTLWLHGKSGLSRLFP